MRITCPSCAAEYEVPGMLAAGRVVRCAKCAGQWTPVPLPEAPAEPPLPPEPPPQPAPPPGMPPAIIAPRRVAFDKELRRSPAPLIAAWVASVAVLAALITAAIVWRDPVMHAWPPSLRLYAALGMR